MGEEQEPVPDLEAVEEEYEEMLEEVAEADPGLAEG